MQTVVNRKRIIMAAMFVISTFPTAVAQKTAGRMSLPAPSGPYGIGRVSYALTEDSRAETLSKTPGARRKVMAFVWYPTDREATSRRKTASYLLEFDKVLPKLGSSDLKGNVPSVDIQGCRLAAVYPGGRGSSDCTRTSAVWTSNMATW